MSQTNSNLISDKDGSLLIANPMYDTAFKSMMYSDNGENKDNARYLIGTILGVEVVEIHLLPNEFATDATKDKSKENTNSKKLSVKRLDFVATIRDKDGKHKQVHIEIQRENNPTDLARFRGYLAEQYKSQQTYIENGVSVKKSLPIIAIYFLGFNLYKIKNVVTHVKRTYIDKIDNQEILQENEFIDGLTHDAYFIQVLRIPKLTQEQIDSMSELELLMSLFVQKDFEKNEDGNSLEYLKTYSYIINNQKLNNMLKALNYVVSDSETRRKLEDEYYDSENMRIWKSEIEDLSNRNANQAIQIIDLSNQNADLSSQNADLSSQNADLSNQNANQADMIARLEQQLRELGMTPNA
jgi:hypothetical protein